MSDAASRFRKGLFSAGLLVPTGMALMFLMNVVLARQLGPAQFGSFSFVSAAATLVALVAAFGVPVATMRFVAQYTDVGQWGLAKGVLRWSFGVTMLAAVIAAVVVAAAAWGFASGKARGNWLLIAVLTLPMMLWLWQRYASLGFHWIRLALIPRDLAMPALVTLLALLAWLDTSRAMIIALAVVLFVLEVGGLWWMRRRFPAALRTSKPEYRNRQWAMTALPLSVTSVMQLGMNRIDLLVLGIYGDMYQTGLYNAAARLALLAVPVSRVVITFTSPLFAAAYNNGRLDELRTLKRRSLLTTLAFGLPLAVILLAVPGVLLGHLYGTSFRQAETALRILAAGQLIALFAVPSSILLWMGGGERRQAVIAATGAACCLGLCIALVPSWGADGAAIAAAVALALTSLLYIWAGCRVRLPDSAGVSHGHVATDPILTKPAKDTALKG